MSVPIRWGRVALFTALILIGAWLMLLPQAEPAERDLGALRDRVARLERRVKRQEVRLTRLRWKTTNLDIDGGYIISGCHDLDAVWDEFGRLGCGLVSR